MGWLRPLASIVRQRRSYLPGRWGFNIAAQWTIELGIGQTKTKFKPHALRHTLGMNLLESSGDITIVKSILGHKRLDTTNIYAESLPEKRKLEINKSSVKFQSASGVDLQKLATPTES